MRKVRVPNLRLHKPTGQGVVTLSGKDFYLGRYDSPDARQRYAKLLAEWEATNRSVSLASLLSALRGPGRLNVSWLRQELSRC